MNHREKVERCLVYNFAGRINRLSGLLPQQRLATVAAVIRSADKYVEIWDRVNINTLLSYSKIVFKEVEKVDFYNKKTSKEYKQLLEKEKDRILSGEFDTIFVNLGEGGGFKFCVELVNLLKKDNPLLKIYALGERVDRLQECIYHHTPNFDALIYGLGYTAVEQIIKGTPLEEISNIIRFKEGKIFFHQQRIVNNIDRLADPIYSKQVYKGINGKFPIYSISLSNHACFFECPFCICPANYGKIVIEKDVAEVIKELKYLLQVQGARYFRIEDFSPPYLALTKLARAIVEEGLHKEDIHFSASTRIDVGGADDFKLLKEAGVDILSFGVESLDEDTCVQIGKYYPFERLKEVLERAYDADIFVILSLICPLPGETKKSLYTTLKRLKEIKPYLGSVLIQPAFVYPATSWYRNHYKYRIRLHPRYTMKIAGYPQSSYTSSICRWLPFPFTYELMGKPAEKVKFKEIIKIFKRFSKEVEQDIGIPLGGEDYDFLAAELMGKGPYCFIRKIDEILRRGNYKLMKSIIEKANQKLDKQR